MNASVSGLALDIRHLAALASESPAANNPSSTGLVDYETFLVDNLKVVENVVGSIARRCHLTRDASDELLGDLRLKLIDNDYWVLRQFEGRSSLSTYLTGVAYRLLLDQRNAQWGKWRPSVEATRQGELALLVERLVARERLSRDEALNVLRINHQVDISVEEFDRIVDSLPERSPRQLVGSDVLVLMPDRSTPAPDAGAGDGDYESTLATALRAALGDLERTDRLVLKFHFRDGMPLSCVARLLDIPQKPLYRRVNRLKELLRAKLQELGVDDDRVRTILQNSQFDMPSVLGAARRPADEES